MYPQTVIVYRPAEYALYQWLGEIGPWPFLAALLVLCAIALIGSTQKPRW